MGHTPIQRRSLHAAAGFSLVEIMVGMVIGMFGIIVMMQVFSMSEAQRRATTSGSDANGNGAIAMFGLQRDIEQAGYGFNDTRILGCNVTLRAGVTLNALAPVTINHASIPAGDANTDTLLVAYGNPADAVQGDGITTVSTTSNSYPVQTPTAFSGGDNLVAVPSPTPTPCTTTLARVVTGYAGNTINPNVTLTANVTSMPSTGGTLFNLGPAPKVLVYAIRNGNLTLCRYTNIDPVTGVDSGSDCSDASRTNDATVWVPLASNIVSLRAEYGHDNSAPVGGASPVTGMLPMPIVNTYDQVTPVGSCALSRTPAVRMVLVARSGQKTTPVTAAAPTWAGSAAAPVDLSANADWQNYRYKVFQNTVSIRNIGWLGVPIGC